MPMPFPEGEPERAEPAELSRLLELRWAMFREAAPGCGRLVFCPVALPCFPGHFIMTKWSEYALNTAVRAAAAGLKTACGPWYGRPFCVQLDGVF